MVAVCVILLAFLLWFVRSVYSDITDACKYRDDFWPIQKDSCAISNTCVKCYDYMYPYPSPFLPSPTPLHCYDECLTSLPFKIQVDGTHVIETIDANGKTSRYVIDNNSNALMEHASASSNCATYSYSSFAHEYDRFNSSHQRFSSNNSTGVLRVLVLAPPLHLSHLLGSRIAHWALRNYGQSGDLRVTLASYGADSSSLGSEVLDLRDVICEKCLSDESSLVNISALLSQYDVLVYDHHGTAILDAPPIPPLFFTSAASLIVRIAAQLADVTLIRYFHVSSAYYMHDYSRIPTSSLSIIDSPSLLNIPSVAAELHNSDYVVLPPSLPPTIILPPVSSITYPKYSGNSSSSSVFRVLFGGGLMSSTCSGAYIKLVHLLHRSLSVDNRDIEYLLLGDGHLRDALVELVELLETRILWLPDIFSDVAELSSVLTTSNLLIDPCPTLSGNTPLYPLAMSVGLPIVAFATNFDAAAMMRNGGGVLVSPPSLPVMVSVITDIYDDMMRSSSNRFNTSALLGVAIDAREKYSSVAIDRMMTQLIRSGLPSTPTDPAMPMIKTASADTDAVNRCYAQPISQPLALSPPAVDPTVAHQLWLRGAYADPTPPPHTTLGDPLDILVLRSQRVPLYNNNRNLRLFCGIFTLSSPSHDIQIQSILSTWGKRCDGFLAFSNHTNSTLQSIGLEIEGGEDYDNMWQKTRAIWSYIEAHYSNSFDWFLLGGDDLYVIVEQLQHYLMTAREITAHDHRVVPLYLGRPLRQSYRLIYNNGGAGYLLNRAAVRLLAHMLRTDMCLSRARVSIEDVLVAHCLGICGVKPRETKRLETSNGSDTRETFHWARPAEEYDGTPSYMIHADPSRFGLPAATGAQCCSSYSVTFQNIRGKHYMELVHQLVYSQQQKIKNEVVVDPDA